FEERVNITGPGYINEAGRLWGVRQALTKVQVRGTNMNIGWVRRLRAGVAASLLAIFVVLGIAAQAANAATDDPSARAGGPATSHSAAGSDQDGVNTRYYWPAYAIGGNDPQQNCLHGHNSYNGYESDWVTSLCRVERSDESGFYHYYNLAAGPGTWFMQEGQEAHSDGTTWVYHLSRLSFDAGASIWCGYPTNNPRDLWISVTPNGESRNKYVPLHQYYLMHSWSAVLAQLRDTIDRGVMLYVRGLVVKQATWHPWIAQSAQQ